MERKPARIYSTRRVETCVLYINCLMLFPNGPRTTIGGVHLTTSSCQHWPAKLHSVSCPGVVVCSLRAWRVVHSRQVVVFFVQALGFGVSKSCRRIDSYLFEEMCVELCTALDLWLYFLSVDTNIAPSAPGVKIRGSTSARPSRS